MMPLNLGQYFCGFQDALYGEASQAHAMKQSDDYQKGWWDGTRERMKKNPLTAKNQTQLNLKWKEPQ